MRLLATIDLTQLSRALEDENAHPALVKAVKLATAVGSIRDDLVDAASGLRLIDQFADRNQTERGAAERARVTTIVSALFDHATILYARATTTKGDRLPLLGTPKDPNDRILHDEILKLRNSVVAHFGRGDSLSDGPLYREAVVLNVFAVGTEQKHQVSVYTQRTANRASLVQRFVGLIDRRLADVMERFEPLQAAVRDRLEEAAIADPALAKRLVAHEFDVDAFFVTKDFADHYRRWVELGGVSGYQDDVTQVQRP